MQVPYFEINSTHGQIGIKSSRPHLEIKQQSADLSIKQDLIATLEISQTSSQLFIDQTEAFAAANLKSPIRSANEFYNKAKQTVMQYVAKSAQEGDQMMRIENGGEVIFPRLAAQNSELSPAKEVNVGLMPGALQVKIRHQPGEISINVRNNAPQINITRREPTIQHRPWQTDIYVRQRQSISFQAVGAQVNTGV